MIRYPEPPSRASFHPITWRAGGLWVSLWPPFWDWLDFDSRPQSDACVVRDMEGAYTYLKTRGLIPQAMSFATFEGSLR